MERQRCCRRYHRCTLLCLMSIMHLSVSFRNPAVLRTLKWQNRLVRTSTTTGAAVVSSTRTRTTAIRSSAAGRVASRTNTVVPTRTSSRNNNSNKSIEENKNNNNKINNNTKKNSSSIVWKEQTGGLRRLPVIPPTVEIRNRARRIGFLTKADSEIKNAQQRAKKHGAETLNALSQQLCLPLRDTVRLYQRTFKHLHPFEQVVAELTISNRQKIDGVELQTVLSELNEARKLVLEATKDWIAKVKDAPTAREADAIRKEGSDALLQLFTELADPSITNLVELQKALRNAPIVQLNVPTMVLVGYPNVGKSSIVRALTTATNIEVNNYPFTTRGLTIGHYDICWQQQQQQQMQSKDNRQNNNAIQNVAIPYDAAIQPAVKHRCQVMDSPGVLNRVDRNAMELLTVAAMQHLPTAVCFVVDLTATAQTTIADQLAVRQSLRERFPKRPWLDVATKADMEFDPQGVEQWRRICRSYHHNDHHHHHDNDDDNDNNSSRGIVVSMEQHIGVEEFSAAVADCLGQVQLVLAAMTALKEGNGGE